MPAIARLSLQADLERLASLERDALAAEWVRAFRVPAPWKSSREFLLKALAHRAEVQASRDVRPDVRKALLRLARGLREGAPATDLPAPKPKLKPGSRLVRAWRGETHEVIVTADGRYEWQGQPYRALSIIATTITGTRRNGPAFFGLREAEADGERTAPGRRPRSRSRIREQEART